MPEHIQTERLVLRPWVDADAVWHRVLVTERDRPPEDPMSYSAMVVVEQQRRAKALGFGLYVIEVRAGSDPIGYCGLVVGRSTPDEPELAYELLRRAHGRGHATEAARAVVTAATDTGRARLWATVGPWNGPSLRVLDKLGFVRDRVERDDSGEVLWARLDLGGSPMDGPQAGWRQTDQGPAFPRRPVP
jgi:RimJ/RimL family protein N-acetyltransferase